MNQYHWNFPSTTSVVTMTSQFWQSLPKSYAEAEKNFRRLLLLRGSAMAGQEIFENFSITSSGPSSWREGDSTVSYRYNEPSTKRGNIPKQPSQLTETTGG
jgi:hypothetical protein